MLRRRHRGRSWSSLDVTMGLRDKPAFRAEWISRRTAARLRCGSNVGLTARTDPAGVAGASGLHGGADLDGVVAACAGVSGRRRNAAGWVRRQWGDDDDRPAG